MKKLSIEEKAKRYDEILAKAKRYYDEYKTRDNILYVEDMEDMFPELKESEGERIRKALLEMVHDTTGDSLWVDYNIHKEDAIAWLEKQGEQKPAKNIVEIWKDMRLEVYQQASGNRHEPNYSDDSTKMFSLTDIDEIIEKMSEQKPAEWSEDNLPEFESYLCLMFQKFRTKGICTNGEIIDFIMEHTQKLKDILVKTPWTEEDEKQARQIERIVRNDGCSKKLQEQIANWFKSLKDRVQPQPKPEWSEEDEKKHNEIIHKIYDNYATKDYHEVVDWLNTLKSRYILQPKQEWNEEDSYMLGQAIKCVNNSGKLDVSTEEIEYWLKSLRPQSQWKPSEEQMNALRYVTNFDYGGHKAILVSLYEQLKKLKG